MKKALLVIDYSNDFVADGGALTCGAAGQALDEAIKNLVTEFAEREDFIFVCNDAHQANDPYDPEGGLFPEHNLVGSWGAELYGESGSLLRNLLRKKPESVYYLAKTRYSAFHGTPLDAMLRLRKVQELTVVGVCTDICVLHTVISASYLGYHLTVPAKGCAAIMEHGQEWALNHMKNCLGVAVAD